MAHGIRRYTKVARRFSSAAPTNKAVGRPNPELVARPRKGLRAHGQWLHLVGRSLALGRWPAAIGFWLGWLLGFLVFGFLGLLVGLGVWASW